ncbi:MAG: glycosyltransferase family 2 protein, partial [Mycobacteriales bacterium]
MAVDGKTVVVVMPAYNAAKTLASTVALIPSDVADHIVLVDDGSRDRTAEVVRNLSATYPEVRLVQHPVNLGYGAAVWTGLTSGQKEFVFFTDADGQFDINEL